MKRIAKSNIILLIVALASGYNSLYAQDTLTVQQAITHALAHNYDVLIQTNNAQITENQAHPGRAGLLPTISVDASATYGIQNTRLEIAGQVQDIENTGAELLNYSAALNLNYTLFSGFANRYRFDRLKINADLADVTTRMTIENIYLQVVTAYYDAIRTQQNISALNESLALSRRNLELARERYAHSGGSKLVLLNAQVNYQRDSLNMISASNIHKNAMITLNLVMGEQDLMQMHQLSVRDQSLAEFGELSVLVDKLEEQNAGIQSARQQQQISMMDLRIAKASYSPVLNLQSSYSVNVTENEGSFILLNQSDGFSAGASLSIPIFTGHTRARNYQNAKITVENSDLKEEDVVRNARAALFRAWDAYETSVLTVELEKEALNSASMNLELSQNQYRNGAINSTQLREAQVNLTVSQNSYNNAVYNLRLAEAELLRLTGQLLQ